MIETATAMGNARQKGKHQQVDIVLGGSAGH